MENGHQLRSPALFISLIALFMALGGSVYAASKISGKAIKVKSMPGNRLALHSIPANRMKPGVLPPSTQTILSRELTGTDINEITLAQVPDAAHADTADTAKSAGDAQTALNAVNAINAETVNGHSAGCREGTEPFAGACWQKSARDPATAPQAAVDCAFHGATLPDALELAAFSDAPGITLAAGGEWSSDLTNFSGPDAYGAVVVAPNGVLATALSTATKGYRCVFPLVI